MTIIAIATGKIESILGIKGNSTAVMLGTYLRRCLIELGNIDKRMIVPLTTDKREGRAIFNLLL